MAGGDVTDQELPLRGYLRAGVAGADDDERHAGGPFLWIVGGVGQFDLPDEVVAQVQCLRYTAEAVRVIGDAGYRQEPVDAAGGQDEPAGRQGRAPRPRR